MSVRYWDDLQSNPLCPWAQVSEYLGADGFCTVSPDASENTLDAAIILTANMAAIPRTQADFLFIPYMASSIIYYFLKNRNNILFLIKKILYFVVKL